MVDSLSERNREIDELSSEWHDYVESDVVYQSCTFYYSAAQLKFVKSSKHQYFALTQSTLRILITSDFLQLIFVVLVLNQIVTNYFNNTKHTKKGRMKHNFSIITL